MDWKYCAIRMCYFRPAIRKTSNIKCGERAVNVRTVKFEPCHVRRVDGFIRSGSVHCDGVTLKQSFIKTTDSTNNISFTVLHDIKLTMGTTISNEPYDRKIKYNPLSAY